DSIEKLTLNVVPAAGYPQEEAENLMLGLAAWLDALGVVEASISGSNWLGTALDPRQVPEIAQEDLAAAQGQLFAALEQNRLQQSIVPLERAIILQEAL